MCRSVVAAKGKNGLYTSYQAQYAPQVPFFLFFFVYLASIDQPTNTITFPPPTSFLPRVQVLFSGISRSYKLSAYLVLKTSIPASCSLPF